MYEFTKKEIRKKFDRTEYGKKLNGYLTVALIVFAVAIIGSLIFEIVEIENPVAQLIVDFIFYMSMVFGLYFDGKRDGAITQYAKIKK